MVAAALTAKSNAETPKKACREIAPLKAAAPVLVPAALMA
ncbi:hypothetical protein LT85_1377 [Collimonas arenae]|uniref:Uncharacterized protein n=1 Tax=Collimonas arenae TaxID=279058 RepID=A0A0A1F9S2_9BURK|nr:hypothetical protein LT85_1377 [Collimonas arenae]